MAVSHGIASGGFGLTAPCRRRVAVGLTAPLHELTVFPNGRYDDQVDSTSQVLDWIGNPRMKGFAFYELGIKAMREKGLRVPGEPPEVCYAGTDRLSLEVGFWRKIA